MPAPVVPRVPIDPDSALARWQRGEITFPTSDPDADFVASARGDCVPLPEATPTRFEVLSIVTQIPRGKAPQTWVYGLTTDRCHVVLPAFQIGDGPPVICRVLTDTARAWAALRAAWGDGFPARTTNVSWHAGSRAVQVRWDGHACEAQHGIATAVLDADRFKALAAWVSTEAKGKP